MSDLPFTGERVVPGLVDPGLWSEHEARYLFAARRVSGLRVLDLGCGAGYGLSALRVAGARQVVGVDNALEAARHAQEQHGAVGARVVAGDARCLPFAAGSFDCVVCFEVIEHLAKQKAVVDEVRRILGSRGFFILSTPNRPVYAAQGEQPNPYHVHELDLGELTALLGRSFEAVQVYGQVIGEGVLIAPLDSGVRQLDGELRRMTSELTAPDYLVAVCGSADRGRLAGRALFVASDANQLDRLRRQLWTATADLDEKRAWALRLDAEIEGARAVIAAHTERIDVAEGQLRAARERIAALESRLASRSEGPDEGGAGGSRAPRSESESPAVRDGAEAASSSQRGWRWLRRQMRRWVGRGSAVALLSAALTIFGTACSRERVAHRDPSTQGGPTAWPASSTPRDLVMIVVDTLRADHVGVYSRGEGPSLTPELDRLAESAVVFTSATATSSWTRSSVATMFASQHPAELGVLGREDKLAQDVTTLAEVLQAAGYVTLGVSTNLNAGAEVGFDQGFDAFVVPTLADGYRGDFKKLVAQGVSELAIELLAAHAGDGRPYFLFLHYVDPHDPYLPHGYQPPGRVAGRYSGSRADLDKMDGDTGLTAADRQRIRALYAGEVRYCDRWIGWAFERLAGIQGRREPVVVVTSDHGEGLWDHGERAHGKDLYQEQIHVPLIVSVPGVAATRVTHPVSLLDLAPTLLALAGVEAPASFRGGDLGRVVSRGAAAGDPAVLAELDLDGRTMASIRQGDMKLIERIAPPRARGEEHELFDLARDAVEQANVAESRGEEVGRLARALQSWRGSLYRQALAGERLSLGELDTEALAALRALGYLDAGEHRRAIEERRGQRQVVLPDVELLASPNPIPVCDDSGIGRTTISWRARSGGAMEIRLGSPEGRLFARGSGEGRHETGRWVTHGMQFVLTAQPTGGEGGGRELARITVELTAEDCAEAGR